MNTDTPASPLYQNLQLKKEQLPEIEQIDFEPVAPKYIWILRMRFLYAPIVPALIYVFADMYMSTFWWITAGYAAILVLLWIVQTLGFKRKGYAVREHDVNYRTGWFFRSTTSIPFNRIQHCELDRGPLERLFDLSTLKIFTAGGSGSDISIPGLQPEVAQQLRSFIIKTAATHEEN